MEQSPAVPEPPPPDPVPAPPPAPDPPAPADPPAEAAQAPSKVVLPDPAQAPTVPPEYRMPFHGKMASPTAAPSATERRAHLDRAQRARRRRGFLIGLLVGQLLVLGLDFGGGAALHLLRDKVTVQTPVPHQALVFIGMTAGIVITMLLILFVLGLQGAGWVFGKKGAGFFTAVGRGVKRIFKAAWALGITLGVIGGTAWFMIPRDQWKPTATYLQDHGQKALQKGKGWVKDIVAPPPSPPPQNP